MAPHDAFSLQIYGKESQFDAARLIDLLGAYESFKVASTSARGSMDAIDVTDTGSSTALPQGTAPGRYEPGSALHQVRAASPGALKADSADLALMALMREQHFLRRVRYHVCGLHSYCLTGSYASLQLALVTAQHAQSESTGEDSSSQAACLVRAGPASWQDAAAPAALSRCISTAWLPPSRILGRTHDGSPAGSCHGPADQRPGCT